MLYSDLKRSNEYSVEPIYNPKMYGNLLLTKGSAVSSPVIIDSMAYFGAEGYLYAVNINTAVEIWKYKADIGITPSIAGDHIYVGCLNGCLYAISKENGNKKWEFCIEGEIASSPAVYKGKVYFGGSNGIFYALNAINGKKEWAFETEYANSRISCSSPAIHDDVICFGIDEVYEFFAIDAISGELIWKLDGVGYNNYLAPLIIDSTVIIYGKILYAFNLRSGSLLWNTDFGCKYYGWPNSSPRSNKGNILLNYSNSLYSINSVSGQINWKREFEGECGIPVSADNVIYIGDYKGYGNMILYAINSVDGKVLWKLNNSAAIVTFTPADNTIFYGRTDGLYAVAGEGVKLPELKLSSTAKFAQKYAKKEEPSNAPVVVIKTISDLGPPPTLAAKPPSISGSISASDEIIYKLSDVDKRPEFVEGQPHLLPSSAKSNGVLKAMANFEYVVDKSGNVSDIRFRISSGDKTLDSLALDIVKTNKYKPARLKGKPVATRFEYKVNFK